VAEITSLGEGGGDVIRIGGRLIILEMAIYASRAGEVVVVVDMAIGALPRRHGVAGGQRKPDGTVIELGVQPVIGSVATIAGAGKVGRDVVGTLGRLEISQVTGRASGGHRLKVAGSGALVAGIAVHDRVCSGQRKPVIVLLNLPD
jgi:hypothetical protein